MRICRWGNSLAIRLPKTVVKALALREGDEIEITVARLGRCESARGESRLEALEQLRALKRPLPEGFRFDRAGANDRQA